MNASTRRRVTLAAALLAAVALVVVMFSAPRFFTGALQAFYTPAGTTLQAPEPAPVGALDPDAPTPNGAILTAQLDAVLATANDGTTFDAQVLDVATGKVLYEKNGNQPGTPASSLKIATAIAALDTLGGDRQLATTVSLAGDTLILRGGGDVLLGDGESDPAATEGHAGIKTLAEQTATALASRGVDRVSVWLDDSLFADAQVNQAWDRSLFTSNNIAPLYPIAHYAGRTSDARGAAHENDAAAQVREVFMAQLATHLEVSQGGRGAHEAGEQLAQVLSAPIRDQVQHMLVVSDNYLAEALGRLVAHARQLPADQAAAAVQAVATDFGANDLDLVDTSGLAADNRISPAALATLLRAAAISDKPELRDLAYSLPVSGYSGTMAKRLTAQSVRGLVRAKTGSLSGVATLTGVTVTDDGRAVAFSIFSHNPAGGLAPHRETLDRAVRTLHACGCR